ncbi:recombinase family protein [Flavobacterium sp. AC]|uniref:Recombinase family protein n=1 Tax=Flavobacterium azizsancarii TaxID=2961580 RepID=A0ABT4W8S3_9FLAO|nr:recombinase family protein [Flavobacterium azizsancarii]MDA6068948.1 recombinase family protein [Flavobacterium azizsancarii]
MNTYIAYIRTSTKRQDLGLEAQQAIINRFVQSDDIIIQTYTEKESGSKSNRIEMNKAIEQCKATGATLLIAKLDRLSRNVAFVSALMESKITLCAIDLPNATPFHLHIFASFAEQELKLIQDRTKSALSTIKDNIKRNGYHMSKAGNRITSLGRDHINDENRLMGVQAIKDKKKNNPNLVKARAFAISLRNAKLTLRDIAIELNNNGFKSSRGGIFYASTVSDLFK